MENNNSFFSVVIPSYNRAHLVKKAIESIQKQTFTDWELIVADDCSTDNTEEIVKEFQNDKIKFVKNANNKGNAGARNLGVKNAKGKYVAFLDSDDQYRANFLEKMHEKITTNNFPGFLWCYLNYYDRSGTYTGNGIRENWEPLKQEQPYLFFLKGLGFGTSCGFTVRLDCFEKTGYFDENLRVAVDTDFILRIVQDFNFNFIKEALIDMYDHEGPRVRRDTSQKLKAYNIILEKHKNVIESNIVLQRKWYQKLMWLSYHNNENAEARKYLKKALKAHNFKSVIIASLFEIFPLPTAINLHKKLSLKF